MNDPPAPVLTLFDELTTPAWLRDALPPGPVGDVLPGWLKQSPLPPIPVAGHCLNEAQVRAVVQALRDSPLWIARPLLVRLREHADAAALDAFAWHIFRCWQEAGGPADERWGLHALGLLGGDASAIKLAPLVAAWPEEKLTQRAEIGLECLAVLGSDAALLQLDALAGRRGPKALQSKARSLIREVCKRRGLSNDQLEDRVVPRLGFDERGERVLDYGPRQFRIAVGPRLEPILRDDRGKSMRSLPRAADSDDPQKVQEAGETWKAIKKALGDTLRAQAERLEKAMVKGRRWPAAEFDEQMVRHPLMGHVCRLLLWGAYGADRKLAGAFRVDDRRYLDAEDRPFVPADGSTIGLAHPALLTPEARDAWNKVFAARGLAQPFSQLARPIHALEEDEKEQRSFTRFDLENAQWYTLSTTLERGGWTHGTSSSLQAFTRHFPGADHTAVLRITLSEGIRTITSAQFVRGLSWSSLADRRDAALLLGEVDAAVLSEVIGTLRQLEQSASPPPAAVEPEAAAPADDTPTGPEPEVSPPQE